MNSVDDTSSDILQSNPTELEKDEMRSALKSPSEWIKLLCPQWASENRSCVNGMDEKFAQYKGYMGGVLSSQALCRISIPEIGTDDVHGLEFWRQLGVLDEIDLRYIISQIERFLFVFSIRLRQESCKTSEENLHHTVTDSQSNEMQHQIVNKETIKREKRLHKRQRQKDRQTAIQEQKEAALKRAAELVQSNRVPLQLMTGRNPSEGSQKKKNSSEEQLVENCDSTPKQKSSIVISTARDLERIVTHANNLYAKYKAIARQHHQRISWATVSKELGLHTKVREKYTRMFNRALERGFNFNTCGHYKIKDHPEIFLHPIIKSVPKTQHTTCDQPATENHSNVVSDTLLLSSIHDRKATIDTNHDIPGQIIDDQVAAAVDAAMQIPVASNHDESLSEALNVQDICRQTKM